MTREIIRTSAFKKDYKKVSSQPNWNKSLKAKFTDVLWHLQNNKVLPDQYQAHPIKASGHKYQGHMDCHVAPNVVLIYDLDQDPTCVKLIRFGSHNEIELTETL